MRNNNFYYLLLILYTYPVAFFTSSTCTPWPSTVTVLLSLSLTKSSLTFFKNSSGIQRFKTEIKKQNQVCKYNYMKELPKLNSKIMVEFC